MVLIDYHFYSLIALTYLYMDAKGLFSLSGEKK